MVAGRTSIREGAAARAGCRGGAAGDRCRTRGAAPHGDLGAHDQRYAGRRTDPSSASGGLDRGCRAQLPVVRERKGDRQGDGLLPRADDGARGDAHHRQGDREEGRLRVGDGRLGRDGRRAPPARRPDTVDHRHAHRRADPQGQDRNLDGGNTADVSVVHQRCRCRTSHRGLVHASVVGGREDGDRRRLRDQSRIRRRITALEADGRGEGDPVRTDAPDHRIRDRGLPPHGRPVHLDERHPAELPVVHERAGDLPCDRLDTRRHPGDGEGEDHGTGHRHEERLHLRRAHIGSDGRRRLSGAHHADLDLELPRVGSHQGQRAVDDLSRAERGVLREDEAGGVLLHGERRRQGRLPQVEALGDLLPPRPRFRAHTPA
ncbi:protein of unknown function [Microbacterium sp. Nx66]|nr:protein of unknown function [Microbacterium sp. Nx66]